jgi:hypothetical protein
MCALLLVVLLLPVFCQAVYCEPTVLTIDDLPDVNGSLTIRSDSTLTIDAGESAAIEGVLVVQGSDDTTPTLEIVNNGDLIIKNTVVCNSANFTIQNNGNLTFDTLMVTLNYASTFSVSNNGTFSLGDVNFSIYGGLLYLTNNCSFSAHNLYIKDQYDGASFTNYGEAEFSECTFVANGAYGKIDVLNTGQMQFNHGVFDVNYGGAVNLNSLQGTLTLINCGLDVSGWSHGQQSQLNIVAADGLWDNCTVVNTGGMLNYENRGEVNMTNLNVSCSSSNGSVVMSNYGPMLLQDSVLGTSGGSLIITNWDSMNITQTVYNSSKTMNLINNGDITAENWLVKTTADQSLILITNNGNITTATSFIADVDISTLTSIGSEGEEFNESSGGTIAVTNNGSISELVVASGGSDLTWLYVLIVVLIVGIVVVLLLIRRKKPSYTF